MAGDGNTGYGGDGGPATEAILYLPNGIALAPDGSLYIATYNNRIRRVGPDGLITTIAGNGIYGYGGDGGPATEASIGTRSGIALAPDGSLYIADTDNNRIRRVGPDGLITTIAGNGIYGYGGDGGPTTEASIGFPSGIALGPNGSLYITDRENSDSENLIASARPDLR